MKSGSRSRHLSIVFHILHDHVSIIARGPHRENGRSSQVGFNARFIRQSPCILDDIFCIYVTIRLMHAPNSNYRTALTSIRTVITSSNNTCCVENFSPWNLYPTRRWWSTWSRRRMCLCRCLFFFVTLAATAVSLLGINGTLSNTVRRRAFWFKYRDMASARQLCCSQSVSAHRRCTPTILGGPIKSLLMHGTNRFYFCLIHTEIHAYFLGSQQIWMTFTHIILFLQTFFYKFEWHLHIWFCFGNPVFKILKTFTHLYFLEVCFNNPYEGGRVRIERNSFHSLRDTYLIT
jgi:hypothetical protein